MSYWDTSALVKRMRHSYGASRGEDRKQELAQASL